MSREKIVITGLGSVAPNGNNVDDYWANLTSGVSASGLLLILIRQITE